MRTLNLRYRISIAIAAICTGIVLFLGVMLYIASERMEAALVDQLLNEELAFFIEHHRNDPSYTRPSGPNIQYYAVRTPDDTALVPDYARTLPPGQYEVDIGEGRGDRDIAVRQIGDMRFIVVYDIGSYEDREREFRGLMGLSLLVAIGLALALGHRAAGVLTRQITRLARAVERIHPDTPQRRLTSDDQDREIATLAQALDDYRLRMLAMVQREQAFTANASHELRTPLTAISTSCDLLALDPTLSAGAHERTRAIRQAVARITEHLRVLLFLARGGNAFDVEALVLADCIDDAASSMRHDAAAKGLRLEIDIPPDALLQANREALHIIVTNLLRNAIACTTQGFVRIDGDEREIRVSDSGIGIAPDEIPKIFERYYRVDSSTGGLGIGLHIVERVCALAGWTIGATSTPSEGSTFTVSFGPGRPRSD